VSEHLDDADLALRRWVAEDRIEQHARRIVSCMALNPDRASAARLDAAARQSHGDHDAFLLAVRELLDEVR